MKKAIFLSLFLLHGLAHAVTLGSIKTLVRYNIRDTAEESERQRYSDTVLENIINEVQKDVNNQTWAVESSTSYALTANTTYYAMPSDYVAVKRAVFINSSSVTRQLEEKSEKGVLDTSPNFEGTSGTPSAYMLSQTKSGAPSTRITYLPVPTSTAQLGTVRVDYVSQPYDLSDDSDSPFNGAVQLVPYHQTIIYGVTFRIKIIEGNVEEAKIYGDLYDRSVQMMRDALGKLPNFRPSLGGGPR